MKRSAARSLLFFAAFIACAPATPLLHADEAQDADSAQARAKICWLWDYLADHAAIAEKTSELRELYPVLNREDMEACDAKAFEKLSQWRTRDPALARELAAVLRDLHGVRRESLRGKPVTEAESTESRAKISYLIDFFLQNGVAPSKIPSLVEMHGRMTPSDRREVEARINKQIAGLQESQTARAGELAALLKTMQEEGDTVLLPEPVPEASADKPVPFTPTPNEWPPIQANLILGTQAIGGPYQFSGQPYLLEVAREIAAMGSNLIKFTASFGGEPYNMPPVEGAGTLAELLEKHPVYREVMDMPFTYYHVWAYPKEDIEWKDGVDEREERRLYDEFRGLAAYLLGKYDGTGKQFYLGHWEGDWTLSGVQDWKIDPTPERIAGFTKYLQIRQRAIEDARREVTHRNVEVFNYVEVNLVAKGLSGEKPTMTNSVLEKVNPDFVSYSCYDVLFAPDPATALRRALDEIESKLKPKPGLTGKRVFVGEFAVKSSLADYDGEAHAKLNRKMARAMVAWGCPFVLYWQFYCNERNTAKPRGYEGYWLVDNGNRKTPLHDFFRGYYRSLRGFIESETAAGRPPSDAAIRGKALELLQTS